MARPFSKPVIFISHIDEEKQIALALQSLLKEGFLDLMEIFVSSNPRSLKIGDEWLDPIKRHLKNCAIQIILASPVSVARSWVTFEAGAVWSRLKPVIVLCHSGLTISKLQYPLKMLQVGVATDEPNLKSSIDRIAEAVGCQSPKLDFSAFIKTVTEFEGLSQQSQAIERASPMAEIDGLQSFEVTILLAIIGTGIPSEGVALSAIKDLGEGAGLTGAASHLAFMMLERKGFLETLEFNGWNETYTAVRLTDKGWDWLVSNHHVVKSEQVPLAIEHKMAKEPTPSYADEKFDDGLPF